jgi:hypothetical protein
LIILVVQESISSNLTNFQFQLREVKLFASDLMKKVHNSLIDYIIYILPNLWISIGFGLESTWLWRVIGLWTPCATKLISSFVWCVCAHGLARNWGKASYIIFEVNKTMIMLDITVDTNHDDPSWFFTEVILCSFRKITVIHYDGSL